MKAQTEPSCFKLVIRALQSGFQNERKFPLADRLEWAGVFILKNDPPIKFNFQSSL